MLLVKVLVALHQVQPLFFFHLNGFFFSFQIAYPRKTYQLAWGNQSWGDNIPDQSFHLRIRCLWWLQNHGFHCQPPQCVGFGVLSHCRFLLFCCLGFDAPSPAPSLSLSPVTFTPLYKPWKVLMLWVPMLFLEMLTNKLAPQRWLPSRD